MYWPCDWIGPFCRPSLTSPIDVVPRPTQVCRSQKRVVSAEVPLSALKPPSIANLAYAPPPRSSVPRTPKRLRSQAPSSRLFTVAPDELCR